MSTPREYKKPLNPLYWLAFCQLTQLESSGEKVSAEKLHLSDCPVAKSVGAFSSLMIDGVSPLEVVPSLDRWS